MTIAENLSFMKSSFKSAGTKRNAYRSEWHSSTLLLQCHSVGKVACNLAEPHIEPLWHLVSAPAAERNLLSVAEDLLLCCTQQTVHHACPWCYNVQWIGCCSDNVLVPSCHLGLHSGLTGNHHASCPQTAVCHSTGQHLECKTHQKCLHWSSHTDLQVCHYMCLVP